MTRNTDNDLEAVGKVTEVQENFGAENGTAYDIIFTCAVNEKQETGVYNNITIVAISETEQLVVE